MGDDSEVNEGLSDDTIGEKNVEIKHRDSKASN